VAMEPPRMTQLG